MFAWFAETTIVAAILATLALLASRTGRLGPAGRHALWFVVLLKMITPPVIHWSGILGSTPSYRTHAIEAESLPLSRKVLNADVPVERIHPAAEPVAIVKTIESETQRDRDEFSEIETPDHANPAQFAENDSLEAPTTMPLEPGETQHPDFPILSVQADLDASSLRAPIDSKAWFAFAIHPDPLVMFRSLAMLCWLIGTSVFVSIQAWRIARFADVLRRAKPAPAWLTEKIDETSARFRVRPPLARVIDRRGSPFLWCAGRATLVIPSQFLPRMEPACWDAILSHELAHLRRWDPWVSRLTLLAGVVWWWNPLYWLVRERLEVEAELSCDAMAVSTHPENRRRFAESLVMVCEAMAAKPAPPALGVGSEGRLLERRLLMILNGQDSGRLPLRGILAAALLTALALPSWTLAQQPAPPEPPATPAPPQTPLPDLPPEIPVPPQIPGAPSAPATPAAPTTPRPPQELPARGRNTPVSDLAPPVPPQPPRSSSTVSSPALPRIFEGRITRASADEPDSGSPPARSGGREARASTLTTRSLPVARTRAFQELEREHNELVKVTQATIHQLESQLRESEARLRAAQELIEKEIGDTRRENRMTTTREVRSLRDTSVDPALPPFRGADLRPTRARTSEPNEIETIQRRMDAMEQKLDLLLKKLEPQPPKPTTPGPVSPTSEDSKPTSPVGVQY